MNKFDECLLSVKNEINQNNAVKEYFYYKNIVDNDHSLKELDDQLKFHQKQMCKSKNDPSVYNKEKALYHELKNKWNSNPVLINYQIAKEEVFSLLVDIKELLG